MAKHRKKNQKTTEEQEFQQALRLIGKRLAGNPEALSAPNSPIKQMIGMFVEAALEEEMTEHLGYEKNQRSLDSEERRKNTRNGYSSKKLHTSQGITEIQIPRDRTSSFEPFILPKNKAILKEVEDKILSLYSLGITQRDLQQHLFELYNHEVSPSFISRVIQRVDPILQQWRDRPLESLYPIVFVDAIYLKIRRSNSVKSVACYVVCAYSEEGKLEVLSLAIAPQTMSSKESASFWHQMMVHLNNRGVEDVLILYGDGLTGLKDALLSVFPAARFQPCVVHMIRNSFKIIASKDRTDVSKSLKEIYQAVSYAGAELGIEALEERWGRKYPSLIRQWKNNLLKLGELFTYKKELRKMIYTTNAIENVHRQARKVTKNRGSFPNDESALRLATLVYKRIHEKNVARNTRGDWKNTTRELGVHFGDRLPENWGFRMLNT